MKEKDNIFLVASKIVGALEKVFPEIEPSNEEYQGSALRKECYNFQLVFKNLQENTIKIDAVKIESDIAKNVLLRLVDSVPVTRIPTQYRDDYYLSDKVGLYPDVLRPLNEFDIVLPPAQWKAVWVSIDIDESIEVGEHKLKFIALDKNGDEITNLTYTLEVINAVALKQNLKKSNWMHYDCIANYHNVEVFSESFYKIFDEYLKAYTHCGFNMLLTPLFTPPLDTEIGLERRTAQLVNVEFTNGEYHFDFSALEKFLDFVMSRGIEYIEFSHLFTQWGGAFAPKIMANVDGAYQRIFGWEDESCGEKYSSFLDAFLPKLVQFIDKKALRGKCYFHLTDEPRTKDLSTYEKCQALVKKHIGDLPTIDALSDYSFYEKRLVDIAVPIIDVAQNFIDKGIEDLFVYYCCWPTNDYYSNRLINMPSQRTRILGLQLYLNQAIGFLHWGFNFYNSAYSYYSIDPYRNTDAGGYFPSGDSFIVYPTEKGVNLSLRAEVIADSFQDYNALKLLESLIGKEKVLELLKKEKLQGFSVYPHNNKWHYEFRRKINELIKEQSKIFN